MKTIKTLGLVVLFGAIIAFGSFELCKYFKTKKNFSGSEIKTELSNLFFKKNKSKQNVLKRKVEPEKPEEFELYLGAGKEKVDLKKISLGKNNNQDSQVKIFQLGAGSPAGYVLGESQLGITELSYELNSVKFTDNGFIKLFWKIRNNTNQLVFLNEGLKKFLNPSKAFIVDRKTQRVFNVIHDDLLIEPIANCMLTKAIPPRGRIECSAKLGNLSFNTPRSINKQTQGNRILIYLPGVESPIKVFRELLV